MARFAREAEIAARVLHPNVVEIVDVDVADAGFFYLVMELVEGKSLDALEECYGRPGWAIPILAQVARGLDALHELSIVHRDIKPANILLIETGEGTGPTAKLADFGISRPAHEDCERVLAGWEEPSSVESGSVVRLGDTCVSAMTLDDSEETVRVGTPRTTDRRRVASVTRAGDFVGTPMYMAPELGRGGELGPACDMFSLGVLAYLVLTGELPFESPAIAAVRAGEEPRRRAALAVRRPELGPVIHELLDRALSFDPDRRPSARDVAEVLSRERFEASQARPPDVDRAETPDGTLLPGGRKLASTRDEAGDP